MFILLLRVNLINSPATYMYFNPLPFGFPQLILAFSDSQTFVTPLGSATSLSKGDELTCCILDVDLVQCCLWLSLNPQLATSPSASSSSSSKRQSRKRAAAIGSELQPGSTLLATVEYKTPHYFVLSCSTIAGARLAYGVMDSVS